MEKQAKEISSWGKNAYVKIPITNTKSKSTTGLIKKLTSEGIKCNITAVLTLEQVKSVFKTVDYNTNSILSIFSGRIADTGRDPVNFFKTSLKICKNKKNLKQASTREVYNLYQLRKFSHIITVPYPILEKLSLSNMNLKLSLDTVKTFIMMQKNQNII